MWSRLILCFFVGLAYATHSPAWKNGKEYSYHVHGRTLALLSDQSKEYSGIVFNATLRVQPIADDKLLFEIRDAIYSQILNKLPYWNVDSSKDWEWKHLELSSRPFEIEMQNGVITDLIVSKDTPNWEANIIKSIVSQFQLNTKGENIVESSMNILPRAGRNSATYKTMEHTVTGHTETLYSINEMPQYILQSSPRWAKHEKDYNPEDPIIEIVKNKNYTNYIELPSYLHGLRNLLHKPTGDQYGSFMSRECLSNALVSGSLDDFTVQTASTTETVSVKPLLAEEPRSSIVSYMHVHLKEMTDQQNKIESVSNPVRVGNLVYSYAASNSNPSVMRVPVREDSSSSEEDYTPRSVSMRQNVHEDSSSSEEDFIYMASPLDQPQQTPLSPFAIGYTGMSIEHKINIVKQVVKRSQQIANDIEDSSRPIPLSVMDKFTNLVALIRLMDVEEIKQAYNQLYTTKRDGQQYYSWVALRDAVAESGTGPALLTIREWFTSNKISATEASELIATISKTVQQPTLEFMRTLFELIKSPSAQEARSLNRTAPLSYASLVRRVYVSRPWKTDIQYASNSFGNFITKDGKRFVEDTVVPYFTEKLEQSISQANTEKIHTYIRVLGNIAHPKVLAAFEPYLEGQKHCSPFQRFLMVISLDKLVAIHSDLGLPIMYKIYRNIGERQEIRIAAIYTLMKAYNMPKDMLADMMRSMSMYTNIDSHEHVNAAIRSTIQNFANLKYGMAETRQPARSAQPFLNQKTYGSQYGGSQVFDDILKQIQTDYIHNIQTVTSEDDRYPIGIEYSSIKGLSELFEKWIVLQGSTSSFEELISQFAKLVQWTHIQKEKQQQQTLGQEQLWSSHNIARLLNMTSWERPQLEGFLYAEINGYLQSLSFNNHSIEELPEAVRYIELQLRDGQRFSNLKFWNIQDLKVSFPTAMGLPFAYDYNQPSVLRTLGNIKASAHPQVSKDNKLNMPETLRLKADTSITYLSTRQGVLSFVTPFDHQKYACGFDRAIRAHIPIRADVDLNLKKMQMKMQFQLKNLDDETHLLHYSTWPFTTRIDILNPQSILKDPNTRVWESENMRSYDQTVGQKESGVAFRVKVQRDRKYMDLGRISQIFWNQGPVDALLALYRVDDLQKSNLDLYLVPEQSTTNRIVIHLGRKQETLHEFNKGGNFKRSTESESTPERMQKAMKAVSQGLKAGKVQGFDVCVEFEGSRSTNYSATAGYAMSFEHSYESKLFVMLKKKSERPAIKPFEITLESATTVHDGNWWQVPKAIEATPTMTSQLEVTFGQNQEDISKVQGEIEFKRSKDRIEFVQRQPIYEQCQREMKDGNKYLHACMTIMKDASRLDDIRMKLQVEKMSPEGRHILEDVQKVMYPNLRVKNLRDIEETKEWSMQARFDPDLKYVNLSAEFDGEQYRMKNIAVNQYASELFVPSTFISTSTLLASKVVGPSNYRPLCVVDKTRISNFNNVTFPADLSKDWTVMFQYVPLEARQGSERRSVHQQLKSQLRNYVILVRENEYSGKDVKIAFSTPTTDYENVEFTLSSDGRISANGKKLLEDLEQRSVSMYNGRVILWREPSTGEVSFELTDKIHLVYDGKRVRLMLKDYGFHNTVRGICGQLNQEPMKDFLTPQNCIARDHKKFIRSYELSDEGKDIRKRLSESRTECVPHKEYLFADIISSEEAQRGESGEDLGECLRFQTLYTESLSEICFTTRPMPVCKSRCSPTGSLSKKVAVHCISNGPVAKLWKAQIDKGASPDFSHKPQTKYVSIQLPQHCVQ